MVATYLSMKKAWRTIFLQVALENLLFGLRTTDIMLHDVTVYNFIRFHFSDSEYCFAAYI